MTIGKTEKFLEWFPGTAEAVVVDLDDLIFNDTAVSATGVREIRKKDGSGFSRREVLYLIQDEDAVLRFFKMDGWLNTLCAYPNPELPVRVMVAGKTDDGHVSNVAVDCENWYPPSPPC
jgi:hypothetical protein